MEWHPGFRLGVDELRRRPGYRGQRYVDLGVEIAVGGRLTPEVVGDAARSGRYALQDLKKVWHCLARFGHPSYRAGAGVRECGRHPGGGPGPRGR
ncbi:hypothetical protein GCM10010232_69040 [Streptomyces amakusaensis]